MKEIERLIISPEIPFVAFVPIILRFYVCTCVLKLASLSLTIMSDLSNRSSVLKVTI